MLHNGTLVDCGTTVGEVAADDETCHLELYNLCPDEDSGDESAGSVMSAGTDGDGEDSEDGENENMDGWGAQTEQAFETLYAPMHMSFHDDEIY